MLKIPAIFSLAVLIKGFQFLGPNPESGANGNKEVDTVVIGAGLSGLIAAVELENNGQSVQVLEAQDYVGGRMKSKDLSKTQSVDYGGQWVGETHYEFRDLLKQLGIRIFPAPSPIDEARKNKDNVFLYDGKVHAFKGYIVDLGGPSEEIVETGVPQSDYDDAMAVVKKFEELAKGYPADKFPYENDIAEEYKQLDSITFAEWVRQNTETEYGAYCINMYPITNGAAGPSDPAETSMLHRIWAYQTSPPSEEPEKYLINGAAGQVPSMLEKQLTRPVRTADPVVSVEQEGGAITVRTLKGETYRAKHVIIAVPPALTGHMYFSPPLSAKRNQLQQAYPMGTVAKILVEYPTKFWLEQGKTGFGSTDYDTHMITFMADSSDDRSEKGVIVCLINAKQYDMFDAFETEEEKQTAVLKELAELLGDDALTPLSVTIGDWPANQYVQGSYAGYVVPLGWTRFGSSLIAPHINVHWASTETAGKWSGYFEGAIVAGKRAALEVLEGH